MKKTVEVDETSMQYFLYEGKLYGRRPQSYSVINGEVLYRMRIHLFKSTMVPAVKCYPTMEDLFRGLERSADVKRSWEV